MDTNPDSQNKSRRASGDQLLALKGWIDAALIEAAAAKRRWTTASRTLMWRRRRWTRVRKEMESLQGAKEVRNPQQRKQCQAAHPGNGHWCVKDWWQTNCGGEEKREEKKDEETMAERGEERTQNFAARTKACQVCWSVLPFSSKTITSISIFRLTFRHWRESNIYIYHS